MSLKNIPARPGAGGQVARGAAADGMVTGLPMPADVARLLSSCNAPVLPYLDAHRLRTIEQSRADWPSVWRMAEAAP